MSPYWGYLYGGSFLYWGYLYRVSVSTPGVPPVQREGSAATLGAPTQAAGLSLYRGAATWGGGGLPLYRRATDGGGGGGGGELSLTLGNAYTGRGVCLPQGSPRARPPAPGAPAHGGSPGARAGRRPHLVAEDLVEGGPGPAQGTEEGEPEPERAVVARLQQHHLRHDQRWVPHVAAELRRHRPPATARRK